MKVYSFLLLACLLIAASLVSAKPPNVVLIISDDQTWNDYGFMGHEQVATPRLDKLASQSLLFERGYVSAPLCRPSLASLVTGMHPHQHLIRGNDPVLPGKVHHRNNKELFDKWRTKMTAPMHKLPSFVRLLKDNGYLTLQTGKWWEENPIDHGFTDAMTHGRTLEGGRHGDVGLEIGRTTHEPYYDFVDKALEEQKPFFVWYGVFLPHTPHNARAELVEKYLKVAPNESTARYWANIEWFDEVCGEVLDYLDKKGITDETMIIYTCDNGWVSNPEQAERSIRSKREPYEDGIRTPIMIKYPGKVTPQRDSVTLVSNIDIAPTILKAAGIEIPCEMAGLDLRDVNGLAKRDRVIVEDYAHDIDLSRLNDLDSNLDSRVLIKGWDKIIAWTDRTELYDLREDLSDRKDLSSMQPEKVSKLKAELQAWLDSTAKPLQRDR
ncbi:MAG: sulfatase-like hydrolase/transferase [Puniceicoccaceae bacterium]